MKLVHCDFSSDSSRGLPKRFGRRGGKDVDVIGLSLSSSCKPYVHDGSVQTVVLWSIQDLGYLRVYASWLLTQNKIPQGAASLKAERLGNLLSAR